MYQNSFISGRDFEFEPCADIPCMNKEDSIALESPSGGYIHIHGLPPGKYSVSWARNGSVIGASYYTGRVVFTEIVEVEDDR